MNSREATKLTCKMDHQRFYSFFAELETYWVISDTHYAIRYRIGGSAEPNVTWENPVWVKFERAVRVSYLGGSVPTLYYERIQLSNFNLDKQKRT